LESQKDASIADIMNSLSLEGPSTETLELKEGALSHRLSNSNAMGALVDPLSSENLIGEDAQLKELSDRVAGLDSELMALALHLDNEFYPCFLTTIASQKWIISHGLRLDIMRCHQSPEYAAAFVAVVGLTIDKGIQAGLVAGINHGKSKRGLLSLPLMTLSWKRGMFLLS
nr:hypothetical protein [Tanacetum cinerariifolium]